VPSTLLALTIPHDLDDKRKPGQSMVADRFGLDRSHSVIAEGFLTFRQVKL
jgi:hypothetical protein